eukprot:767014-Hanusia_phi.AAC.1
MSAALVPAIERAGGRVLVTRPRPASPLTCFEVRADVEEILVQGSRAVGVRLVDGTEIKVIGRSCPSSRVSPPSPSPPLSSPLLFPSPLSCPLLCSALLCPPFFFTPLLSSTAAAAHMLLIQAKSVVSSCGYRNTFGKLVKQVRQVAPAAVTSPVPLAGCDQQA